LNRTIRIWNGLAFPAIYDVGVAKVITSTDIELPENKNDGDTATPWWSLPQKMATNILLDAIGGLAALNLLSGMYNDAMETTAGGEFAVAVEACKAHGVIRPVLANRETSLTIRRASRSEWQSFRCTRRT
jgi:hypothetical protein